MFLDGVTYAAISKNMANGIGEFWAPQYVNNGEFWGHPPLALGMQGLFFKLFGNGFYVERIYSLFTAILTAYSLSLCWRLFKLKESAWMPILIWISIPIIFWSYQNNMLENTMTPFALLSCYFILKTTISNEIKHLIWASIFLVSAFLSKGIVAVFPIGIPIIYALIINKKYFLNSIRDTIILIGICLLIVLSLFLIFPESKIYLENYFQIQVISSVKGENEITTPNRLVIILFLLSNTFPILILHLAAVIHSIKKKAEPVFKREALLFILIGATASLPIIVSVKQREFYLVPSLAFFALGFALLFELKISALISKVKSWKWIKVISFSSLIFVLGFSIFQFGKFYRSELILKDIYTISEIIPKNSVIGNKLDLKYKKDYSLHAYLARVNNMSLSYSNENYMLTEKDENSVVIEGYSLVPLNLNLFELHEKIPDILSH